jgi:pericentriolar material 1 protein
VIPVDVERPVERNIPIELTNQPSTMHTNAVKTIDHVHLNGAANFPIKIDNEAKIGDPLQEKINEISAMKAQLKRLQDMMNTVKLIEEKTGRSVDDLIDETPEDNEESDDNVSVISHTMFRKHWSSELCCGTVYMYLLTCC